jgi:hypothetical protein
MITLSGGSENMPVIGEDKFIPADRYRGGRYFPIGLNEEIARFSDYCFLVLW